FARAAGGQGYEESKTGRFNKKSLVSHNLTPFHFIQRRFAWTSQLVAYPKDAGPAKCRTDFSKKYGSEAPTRLVPGTDDRLKDSTTITRQLVLVQIERHWSYGRGIDEQHQIEKPPTRSGSTPGHSCAWSRRNGSTAIIAQPHRFANI
ncbi:MAG: hypothetical protein V3T05_09720, partial [Myxococcota bacterium]